LTRISRSRGRVVALAAAAWLGTGALAIAWPSSGGSPGTVGDAEAAALGRPNVLVIETDDQTVESMRVMANVESLIAEKGATFDKSFVNFSLCCPSRVTFLTGQYMHNHGVTGNSGPTGGFNRFEALHAHNNLAVWLKRAGYYTGLIGKYLNGYVNDPPVPPGWSEWHVATPLTQNVYDYPLNDDGIITNYGDSQADFKQDVFTGKAVDFVNQRAPLAKPFFLWLTYTAPHAAGPEPNPRPPSDCPLTAKPAPRDGDAFATEPLPMLPNFNERDVSDKPQSIRTRPLLDDAHIASITTRYRCRLESLLSVDEGVRQVIDALKANHSLKDTYVIFTSDNGFFAGEHRVVTGKGRVYEESVRVPLVMRGPGIPHGVNVRDLSINADLAPTIIDATGAKPNLVMDGRSLLPLAERPGVERGRELLFEAPSYVGVPSFTAIRTQRYLLARYATGERELYDLERDPYELRNRVANPGYGKTTRALAHRLRRLKGCSGASCRRRPALNLDLQHRIGHQGGELCARNPIRAEVAGRDADRVVKAIFYVRGQRVGVDHLRPFRLLLPNLHGTGKVRSRASLVDGRRVSLAHPVNACG
jgi:N-acetylglucosamine-6-sulfatase